MRNKSVTYNTKEELKTIEVIDSNVSKKYVPIYSTELIDLIKDDFEFDKAVQFRTGSTKHYVDVTAKDGSNTFLRIYNSYDRSLALRISLISDGVQIPLGIDRLVHIGQKAKNFKDDWKDASNDIKEAIKTASVLNTFMTNTDITKELAEKITKEVFKLGKKRELVEAYNPVDVLVPNVSIKEYIKKSVTNYLQGEYQYLNKAGKTIKGPKQGSVTARIRVENRVIAVLKEDNPELFL